MVNLQCDLSDQGDAETLYNYLNGYLFPIKRLPYDITDMYRIIAKLGFGGFSTVWLAIGIHKDNLNRWFAIKICGASKNDDEKKVKDDMKRLERKSQNIVPCLDTFKIKSRHDASKRHLCVVMKVSGPSIGVYLKNEIPSFDKRRLLAISSTKVIMELHQNGIILDDLSSSNLLMRVRDLSRISETQLREKIGELEKSPVETQHPSIEIPSHVPTQIYESKSLSSLVGEKLELDVIDILPHGSIVPPDRSMAFTPAYAAPEILEKKSSTIESNIWGLGCLICEIMTLGNLPFEGQRYVGPSQYDYFGRDDDGKLKHLLEECSEPRGHASDRLNPEQLGDLAKLLRQIFVKNPSLRPSAKTILECLNDPKLGKKPISSVNAKPRSDSGVSFSIGTVVAAPQAQIKPRSSTKTPSTPANTAAPSKPQTSTKTSSQTTSIKKPPTPSISGAKIERKKTTTPSLATTKSEHNKLPERKKPTKPPAPSIPRTGNEPKRTAEPRLRSSSREPAVRRKS
ncbi:putative protein kinase [Sclerotinia borealis F-4128]|uniref:Protein kinase domain-containing protein n=1 Tax=Sclerotinia borealis (strain F-4128) TaxID=1432307 RepID=W9CD00_SCLBF|nr:putative protein kinase [Sclerotinia borealis F-4128]